jgi:hypothetical protein
MSDQPTPTPIPTDGPDEDDGPLVDLDIERMDVTAADDVPQDQGDLGNAGVQS